MDHSQCEEGEEDEEEDADCLYCDNDGASNCIERGTGSEMDQPQYEEQVTACLHCDNDGVSNCIECSTARVSQQ